MINEEAANKGRIDCRIMHDYVLVVNDGHRVLVHRIDIYHRVIMMGEPIIRHDSNQIGVHHISNEDYHHDYHY